MSFTDTHTLGRSLTQTADGKQDDEPTKKTAARLARKPLVLRGCYVLQQHDKEI